MYVASGHHVVVAGGQRCQSSDVYDTSPVTQGGGVYGLCVDSDHTSRM